MLKVSPPSRLVSSPLTVFQGMVSTENETSVPNGIDTLPSVGNVSARSAALSTTNPLALMLPLATKASSRSDDAVPTPGNKAEVSDGLIYSGLSDS